jgi:hypothetical protein
MDVKAQDQLSQNETVTFGMEEEEQDLVANMLNCKVG